MLLRARTCKPDAYASFQKIYEVKPDNTEIENIFAQSLWEAHQTETQLTSPIHLQVITQRRAIPILVLEFPETGCNCIFQSINGIAQWCIELVENHTLPAGCNLISHEFVTNKLMPVTGGTFCSLLNLLDMEDIKLPAWITREPVWINQSYRPTSHVINISLGAASGSTSRAVGHVSMIIRQDTALTEIFHVLRREWPNFSLRHLGGRDLIPVGEQKLYSYDLVKTQGTLVGDLGLGGKTWFMPEPLSIEPVPRRLRRRG